MMSTYETNTMRTLLSLLDSTESIFGFTGRSIRSIFRSIGISKLAFFMSSIIRLYPTDKKLDKKLKQYLDDPNSELYRIDPYYVKFNDLILWGENIPYACFSQCNKNGHPDGDGKRQIPSRATCYRILKRLGEI